ncbi:hypothetical protein ACFE04_026326 [Oxalis oulophora]
MEIQVIPSMEIQVSSSMEIQVVNEENVILSIENQVSSSTKNLPDHLSSSTHLAIIFLIVGDQFDKEIYAIRAATVNDRIYTSTKANESWDSLQASPPPIVYLDFRRQALRCDASGAFLDFPFPLDLGGNDLARDDVNIDTSKDVAHPSRERHSSDPSNLGGDDSSHGNMDIDIPQDAAYHSKKRHSSDLSKLKPRKLYSRQLRRSLMMRKRQIRHLPMTPFLRNHLPLALRRTFFVTDIGFAANNYSDDNNEHFKRASKALASASQLSSSCASALATTMSISHELPHMSLPLPPLSSLCTIASSTTLSTLSEPLIMPPSSSLCAIASSSTLRTLSEFPIMPHSLPPLTSLSMTSPLTTSENTISSLVSTYPSSYVPPIMTSIQSTVISTPVTMLGSLVTCTPDVSTTFPRALLTQSLSTVTILSIISSSIIPSLYSSSAGVFSSSTFAKAISEVMSVVAMTRDVHSDELSETKLKQV